MQPHSHTRLRAGLPAVLAAGLIAALALAPDAAAQKQPPVPPEYAFLPADAPCFIQVRVGDLWNSAFYEQLLTIDPGRFIATEDGFENYLHIRPGDIESLTAATYGTPYLGEFLRGNLGGGLNIRGGLPRVKAGGSEVPKAVLPDKGPDKEPPAPPRNSPQPEAEQGPVVIVTTTHSRGLTRARAFAALDGKKADHKGKTCFTYEQLPGEAILFLGDRTLVRGPLAAIHKGIDRLTDKMPHLPRWVALAKNAHHHIVIDSKTFGRDPDARSDPEERGWTELRPFAPLLKARGKQVMVSLGKTTTAEVHASFATDADAAAAKTALEDYVALFRILELGELAGRLERLIDEVEGADRELAAAACLLYVERLSAGLKGVAVKQEGSALTAAAKTDVDMAAMVKEAKGFLKARAGDEKAVLARYARKSQDNLKQIGLGLLSYHDAFKQLPPWAVCDKKGNPLLSWRVLVLPFMEEAALFNLFKLDEPWDGPNNIKLLEKMPKVFAAPGVKAKPGTTHYQGFVGKGAGWELMPDAGRALGARGIKILSITDGTSNTLAVAEATEAVPWTKPADLPFDEKTVGKIGRLYPGQINVLLFDGSVRPIRSRFDEPTLRALITRAGGEVVVFPD
jgi:hypothetical protein